MELWYPDAVRNVATSDGGAFEAGRPYRGVLHTTESQSFTPSSTDYGGWHSSYPHFTAVDRSSEVVIYQHIPIDRAARALANPGGGVQTNRARAVQIEIVGKAAESASMSVRLVRALTVWMRWVESQTGIRREAPFAFRGSEAAGTGGASRMTGTEWNGFNGWCGHQHVPENSHWDPGKIRIEDLLGVPHAGAPDPLPDEPGIRYRVVEVSSDDVLNIRSGAGVGHKLLGSVPSSETGLIGTGAQEVVSGTLWVNVSFSFGEGWASSKFLERIEIRPELKMSFAVVGVAVDDSLNLRKAPGVEYDTLCSIPSDATGLEGSGAVVTVGVSDWYEVSFAGFTGWTNGRFLTDRTTREAVTRGPTIDSNPYTHGYLKDAPT